MKCRAPAEFFCLFHNWQANYGTPWISMHPPVVWDRCWIWRTRRFRRSSVFFRKFHRESDSSASSFFRWVTPGRWYNTSWASGVTCVSVIARAAFNTWSHAMEFWYDVLNTKGASHLSVFFCCCEFGGLMVIWIGIWSMKEGSRSGLFQCVKVVCVQNYHVKYLKETFWPTSEGLRFVMRTGTEKKRMGWLQTCLLLVLS